MGLLSFLFGNKIQTIQDFKTKGAIIIDVRTPKEYQLGAISGSKNIPLQTLSSKIDTIKIMNKPIITCCASGVRSGKASRILKSHGLEVINGGGWQDLNNKLK